MRGTRQSRLPSLAAIQAFEAAARLGGFEPAGSELGVTASAIGKRITTLEAQLDTVLFVRGRHGGTLTAAGREYLEQVRSALGQLSAATLKARVEPPTELLRVVSTPTFARQVLIPYLPEFTDATRKSISKFSSLFRIWKSRRPMPTYGYALATGCTPACRSRN